MKIIVTAIFLIISTVLSSAFAQTKTCQDVASDLLKLHGSLKYGICPHAVKKCSFNIDSESSLPAINISYENGNQIKTSSTVNTNTHWYFEVTTSQQESNSFPTNGIVTHGTNIRRYSFINNQGNCSLENISVKFLPEGKNDNTSTSKTLNFAKCKKLSTEYQTEIKRYHKLTTANKNYLATGSSDMQKYGELCSNSLEFFPESHNKALNGSKSKTGIQ